MQINWPLIGILFSLTIPGACIAVSRLIHFLLANNSLAVKQRFSRFAIMQTLLMAFIMSIAGTVLSTPTGMGDPLLINILVGHEYLASFLALLVPVIGYTLAGFIIFAFLYYGVMARFVDQKTMSILASLRATLGLDGCVLYAVVEEVIARWGLMNLFTYFAIFLAGQVNQSVILASLILSGLLYAASQIPIYVAAGCYASRPFVYFMLSLYLWQSLLFGYLFWHYGLIAAVLGHMLFHGFWAMYRSHCH